MLMWVLNLSAKFCFQANTRTKVSNMPMYILPFHIKFVLIVRFYTLNTFRSIASEGFNQNNFKKTQGALRNHSITDFNMYSRHSLCHVVETFTLIP